MSPVNPPAPEPPVIQRVAQAASYAGKSVLASSGFWAVLGAIVGGALVLAAGVVL